MRRRIMIVAGEPSGDAHGGRLARELLALEPSLELLGMGGAQMRAAGVNTLVDSADLSVMGFAETLGRLAGIVRSYRRLARELRRGQRPDVLVLIDFPDFNLRLARVGRSAGCTILYYVSPQVWAWRAGRIAKIRQLVDRMVVLFPFEVDLYRRQGVDARFFGHPLAEEVRATCSPAETRERWSFPSDGPLVALLPGSRRKEVTRMLPAMLGAAALLGDRACFAVAEAPGLAPEVVEAVVAASGVRVAVVQEDTYNLVAAADVAVVASGTATVECAVLGCPMVVVYRTSPMTYAIARRLVQVPFIAMPNIVVGERIVPELIQEAVTPHRIAAELVRYLESESLRRETRHRLESLRETLVVPGAAARAASLVLELVG